MKIKVISYGYKFYEELGLMPPKHDFLFNLRDLNNPFWVPELKPFNGKDVQIQEFFLKDTDSQIRLKQIQELAKNFVHDFMTNSSRKPDDELVFAFRCTGGKHRSVYFAEQVYKSLVESYATKLALEIEHVDLKRHATV